MRATNDPWTREEALLALLGLPLASGGVLHIAYGASFPTMRSALLMTLVTCLAAVAGSARRSTERSPGRHSTSLRFSSRRRFLLLYPGPREALGRFSDPYLYGVLLALMVIHGGGFWLVRSAHDASTNDGA